MKTEIIVVVLSVLVITALIGVAISYKTPVFAKDALEAIKPSEVPLSEIEKLKLQNAVSAINQFDTQVALIQERRARLAEVELPKLIDQITKDHKLDASWQLDMNKGAFVKAAKK